MVHTNSRFGLTWFVILSSFFIDSCCHTANEKQIHPMLISADSDKGIFILGGIHQAHEKASLYTYQRMGDIYRHLQPEVLAVECEQKFIEDKTYKGMPYDFRRYMVPAAVKDRIPIYGIDWWDEQSGKEWQQLQERAGNDKKLKPEIALFEGLFGLLDEYFLVKDFQEINAEEITSLWAAKSEFKYNVLSRHQKYRRISEYEDMRNRHILENIVAVAHKHPTAKILVAIGIDHKYFLERALREKGLRVFPVNEVIKKWWR